MKDTPEYQLVELLKQYDGVDYLSVKRHGNSLIIYSTGENGSQNHAKFTSLGGAVWGLSFPVTQVDGRRHHLLDPWRNWLGLLSRISGFTLNEFKHAGL